MRTATEHNRGILVMSERKTSKWLAVGIGVGIAIGAGVGAAIHNTGAGVGAGLALGVAVGLALQQRENRESKGQ